MMAVCIVTLGGMGSGIAWSSAYVLRGGRLRDGGEGSLVGETSFRLRRREGGAEAAVEGVGGPVGSEGRACWGWWETSFLLRLREDGEGSVVRGPRGPGTGVACEVWGDGVGQVTGGLGVPVGTGVGTGELAEGE